MNGEKFFDALLVTYSKIMPYKKTDEFFMEMKNSLRDLEIIDYFVQIKKDDKGSGLELEAMFFDNKMIHDISFTSTSVDINVLPIKYIDLININAFNTQQKSSDTDTASIDKLELIISTIGQEQRGLIYRTDTKKFSDFIRIKENLLKLL